MKPIMTLEKHFINKLRATINFIKTTNIYLFYLKLVQAWLFFLIVSDDCEHGKLHTSPCVTHTQAIFRSY